MKKLISLVVLTSLFAAALPALVSGQGSPRNQSQAAVAERPFVPNQILVKFKADASEEQRASARARAEAEVLERIETGPMRDTKYGEIEVLHGPPDVARAVGFLRNHPAVEFAEPNYIYQHETDPYYADGRLWGMYGDATSPANQYGSQAAEAWAAGHTGSKSVYVGVIDEGIQYAHPDLDANVWTNPFDAADGVDNDGNGYVDDLYGWDFAGNDNTIYDGGDRGNLDDHGTHVSGTIGAEANGAGVVGVNWNVTLISGKFLGRNGGTTANAVKAVDYFTDLKTRHGLNVVATNNSWGGGGYSQALFDAIGRANAANILFVAAAGNGGRDGVGDNNDSTPHYPSSYANANIISVASITSGGAKSSFSNYGATSVDIGAPGSGIYSTLAFNGYGSYSGTSMATPHVTGAVALYASVNPDKTAAQIKSAILSSAVPTSSLSGRTVTGGRLDVNGALLKP